MEEKDNEERELRGFAGTVVAVGKRGCTRVNKAGYEPGRQKREFINLPCSVLCYEIQQRQLLTPQKTLVKRTKKLKKQPRV